MDFQKINQGQIDIKVKMELIFRLYSINYLPAIFNIIMKMTIDLLTFYHLQEIQYITFDFLLELKVDCH